MKLARSLAGCMLMSAVFAGAQRSYVGFDKNGYPGDDLLPALRKTFAYTGYWLNNPPGMSNNPWTGKRRVVRAAGFGFLVLFNGRLDAQLKGQNAAAIGRQDAANAVDSAKREGFPSRTIIFLDQEEGGRLLPEQAGYIGAWIVAMKHSGYNAGVYCSGIAVPSGAEMISTARDIGARFPGVKLWVWDDRCPPAPGCVVPVRDFDLAKIGLAKAFVWQYAQSPRRPEDTGACQQTYGADGLCYAPGPPHSESTYVDLNLSRSSDPSRGR